VDRVNRSQRARIEQEIKDRLHRDESTDQILTALAPPKKRVEDHELSHGEMRDLLVNVAGLSPAEADAALRANADWGPLADMTSP
jgi:hypothetical protein